MKNIRIHVITFITAAHVVLFTACNDDNENKPQTLSATPTELTFAADETQTQTVEITTNADFWLVEKSENWIKHSKSGNKLFISVQNYTNTLDVRTATVTIISSETQPVDIAITQEAKIPNTFSVNPTSLSYDANEIGNRTVVISTDADSWDATTDVAWITLVKQDNILHVFASEENTASTPRIANIKITAGDAPEITLTVTQAAVMFLYSEPDSLFFEPEETGEKMVHISTNATNWDAIADSSWVKLIKQNNTLKVIVNEKNTQLSSRIANVKITADKARDFILPVKQTAIIFLTADPDSLSFRAYETSNKRVTISTNAETWDATTDAYWIKLTKQDDELQVATERNNSGLAREAEIMITADKETIILPVTQAR